MTSRPLISASMMNPREGRVTSGSMVDTSFALADGWSGHPSYSRRTAVARRRGRGLLEFHLQAHCTGGGRSLHGLRDDEDTLGAELLVRKQRVAHGAGTLLAKGIERGGRGLEMIEQRGLDEAEARVDIRLLRALRWDGIGRLGLEARD